MNTPALPQVLDRFAEVWAMDFEYIAQPGERPDAVCMVAHELRTGRRLRVWDDELRDPAPIAWRADACMVAYYAPAELSCFLALGWPVPPNVLDLFAEFRTFANGRDDALGIKGASLLAALAHFGLSHLDPEVKANWRERILRGRPYSDDDAAGILDYCESDVTALRHLLPALVARLESRPHWLEHALLRGRYMKATAAMEHRGVPVDAALLVRLAANWEGIKAGLIDEIRAEFPVFEGTTLRLEKFEAWLMAQGIPWPRTELGRLSLAEDTFRTMERAYPLVAPLRELRGNLGKLRLTDLAAGRDGRNRTMLSPFRARSGRNAPSASRFIFAPSVWLRSLIRPEPGRALAYIDYTAQEIAVAAALSGDAKMLAAYQSGDPYLSFAKDAKLAPPEATKATHKAIRDRCKALVLGVLYGMGEKTLAGNLNVPTAEARVLLRAHRRTYSRFWEWQRAAVDSAMMHGYLDTCFGWRLHVGPTTLPTSLLNHPMQSHGAEMLRLACCYLVEAGVELCAPVHDAVLIEAPAAEIGAAVTLARKQMARAARVVLAGVECGTDATIVLHPDRYSDRRGAAMWHRVMALLEKAEPEPSADFAIPDMSPVTYQYPQNGTPATIH